MRILKSPIKPWLSLRMLVPICLFSSLFCRSNQWDLERLKVTGIKPAAGTTNVPIDTDITISFNREIDTASANIEVFNGNQIIPGEISSATNTLTFKPRVRLAYDSDVVIVVPRNVKDRNGNEMDEEHRGTCHTKKDDGNNNGSDFWYTFLGGLGTDSIQSIQPTSDGGYIAAGYSSGNIANLGGKTPINPYSAANDFLVIKLTAAGNVSWYTFLGGPGSDIAYSIAQTNDGGYIIGGSAGANISTLGGQTPLNAYNANVDFIVVKLTATGSVSWYTFLGSTGGDNAYAIQQTNDNGYVITGYAAANITSMGGQTPINGYVAGNDILVVKLNITGAISWYTFLGSIDHDSAYSIKQTNDSGFILAGYATANISNLGGQTPLNPYVANSDTLVVKLNASGAVSWYSFLGGSGADMAYSIQKTSDGGFVIAGFSSANITNLGGQSPLNAYSAIINMLIVKLTAAGAVSWYTFIGNSNTVAYSIDQTSDAGYIISGYSSANIPSIGGKTPLNNYTSGTNTMVLKLNAAGSVSWYTFLGDVGGSYSSYITQTSTGNYILGATTGAAFTSPSGKNPVNPYTAAEDFAIIKFKSDGTF